MLILIFFLRQTSDFVILMNMIWKDRDSLSEWKCQRKSQMIFTGCVFFFLPPLILALIKKKKIKDSNLNID